MLRGSVGSGGGGAVVVTGRLTIPTADGDLLHYSAVASELLEPASNALLLRLLRRRASGVQRRWRFWVWSCGDNQTGIPFKRNNEFAR